MTSRRAVVTVVLLLTALGTVVLFAALSLRGETLVSGTVLVYDVPTTIEEAPPPFRAFPFPRRPRHGLTLPETVEGLRRAARDGRVAGLILRLEDIDWGWGKTAELRDALLAFRASGKPVYASLTSGGELEYLLASAADVIAMPPTAVLQLDGLSLSATFFKGTFDKLDMRPNFARAGRYKTGVEPYLRDGLSPDSRASLESLMGDMLALFADTVASARGFSPDEVVRALDQGPYLAPEAVRRGLVDTLLFAAEIDSLAFGEHERHPLTLSRYVEQAARNRTGPRIALVTAAGTIVPGKSGVDAGQEVLLGSETLIEALQSARERSSVKAVVLRIDSPGGVYQASDAIWREVTRCSEAKPVVVSMSDIAASGGYYIAVGGDRIVAQPSTWTGSIGVYGGKVNILGLYRKVGLNVETIASGPRAQMMSPFSDFSPDEARVYQEHTDAAYRIFLSRVAAGRDLSIEEADSLGQGRVWSGRAAFELGLVDTLGGLETALQLAADAADLERDAIAIERFPKVEYTWLERVLADLLDPQSEGLELLRDVGQLPFGLPRVARSWLAALGRTGGILALLPYGIVID